MLSLYWKLQGINNKYRPNLYALNESLFSYSSLYVLVNCPELYHFTNSYGASNYFPAMHKCFYTPNYGVVCSARDCMKYENYRTFANRQYQIMSKRLQAFKNNRVQAHHIFLTAHVHAFPVQSSTKVGMLFPSFYLRLSIFR